MSIRSFPPARPELPRQGVRRAAIAISLACAVAATIVGSFWQRAAQTSAALRGAASRLETFTNASTTDDRQRAAIAWGYSERLRLGLDSPFRLVEAAARDPRLSRDERRTVSWALLARVVSGNTHEVDAAALDLLGPWENGRSAVGEQHLALIESTVAAAENPRAGELAIRLAYTLASAERSVDGSALLLAAEAAALVADREVARREARNVVRTARGADPIEVVRDRRARRAFYVERPVLLLPSPEIERAAIATAENLLDSIRSMRPRNASASEDAGALRQDDNSLIRAELCSAGKRFPPAGPLAVTVQRYLPLVRSHVPSLAKALDRVRNAEMLVAAAAVPVSSRAQRRAIGRMLLASAVSMRSAAQDPVWFEGDSAPSASQVASNVGLEWIRFDDDVPATWRPFFLKSLADGIRDLRRVLPVFRLDGARVRFRVSPPADSALAMHDPRTRTLHLPVTTAAGTLAHELAHDLDRQGARRQGFSGYRSDHVARATNRTIRANGRIAASLQALADELSEPYALRSKADRSAEVFATRVDWFVANALAAEGRSNGFLSVVQDELLTGHVVHPERLRSGGSSRFLVTALEGMTPVASFASLQREPGAQAILGWALEGPVDRLVAAEIVGTEIRPWQVNRLLGRTSCDEPATGRWRLIRLAAESRARRWLFTRARWIAEDRRPAWARATLGQGPWSTRSAEKKVSELRDHILIQLGADEELQGGVLSFATPLVVSAHCSTD